LYVFGAPARILPVHSIKKNRITLLPYGYQCIKIVQSENHRIVQGKVYNSSGNSWRKHF